MKETSDIDLRIDRHSIRGLQFADLLCSLENMLEKKIDLISTAGADEEFLNTIRKDEILLYERN